MMAAAREKVLYYNPEKSDKIRIVKIVLVRMGIRIRNIDADEIGQKVGYLAGLDGFAREEGQGEIPPAVPEEMMVLYGFDSSRLDELLRQLRRAKASVALKAVLTESNCDWSFRQLYEEIRAEHEMMMQGKTKHQV